VEVTVADTRHDGEEATGWAEVSDWIEARDWAQPQDEPRATLVYRGSSAGRRLESQLLRRGEAYAGREAHILGAFRRYAHRSGRADWSEWEWLALAQHHGLPTRLLDFTFSPLIALHFATRSKPDEPGLLWAVDYQRVHRQVPGKLRRLLDRSDAKLFSTEQLAGVAPSLGDFDSMAEGEDFAIFWEPPSIDERIINQSAVFSLMSSPTARFGDWLRNQPDCGRVLSLSPRAKGETRKHLDLAGITERLLFPDLSGLAAWVARYYE
jgi:hypothetical protein